MKKILQHRKGVLALLLVLFLGMGTAYAYDFSATCSTGQTLYYNIIDYTNHYVEITYPGTLNSPWGGFTEPAGNINLPSTVTNNGISYTVTKIRWYAFFRCSGLTGSLTIPNTVTEIGEFAFQVCDGFTGSLNLGNSVTTIGNYAFMECGFTGPLSLPNSLTTIGQIAFAYCTGFTGSLNIPNAVTSIGEAAFAGCTGFNGTLTVGTGVTSLGASAFKNCSNFTQVKYNAINCDGVEDDAKPFYGCRGTLTIGDAVQNIPSNMFLGCTGFTKLNLGNSVTSIGWRAFDGCSGFTGNLVIPNSVTEISDYAFRNCTGLTGGLTLGSSLTSIGNMAFAFCGFTGTLTLPNSLTTLGQSAFYYCTGLSGPLTIPASLTQIKNSVFCGCSGLTGSLTIPNTVTSIGLTSFDGCSGFTGMLTIGTSVSSIGEEAFKGCSNLSSMMVYPETPPTLGTNVFGNVPKAIPVKVPCNKLSAYQNASGWIEFTNMQEYCDPLTYSINPDGVSVTVTGHVDGSSATGELFIPETKVIDGVSYTVTAIGNYAFNQCTGLTGDLIIPNTVTSIGRYAFQLCTGFTSLTLSNSLTRLEGAFYLCRGMTGNLTLPNSLTEIGSDTFGSCGFTGSLSIPNSVTVIGDGAFWGCTGFTGSLTIPNSVTTIGDNAFKYCPGFNGTLTIGTGVTSIGDAAFDLCTGLTHINYNAVNCGSVSYTTGNKPFEGFQGSLTIGNTVQTIPAFMFYKCYGLTGSLTIPNSVTKIDSYAFYNCYTLTSTLTIPNSVTEINHAAFAGCYGFTSLTLGNALTKLDKYAFSDCSGLRGTLILPNSLTTINNWAFENCTGLTGILTIPNSVTSIGKGAFRNCSGFTQVQFNAINCADFPSADNDETPFLNITGTLTFGNNVQRIPGYMFLGCTGLTGSLTIPNSVTEIGNSAFYNCHGFDHLYLGNSLTSIGVYAFYGCWGFTGTLTLPESVTSLETYAFCNCSGFTSLTIGSSVNWMSYGAFYNCTGLTSITVHPETPPTLGNHLGNNVFYNVDKTIPVYVPCGSISDYQAASGWSEFTNYQCLPWTVTLTANPYDGGDAVFMVGDGTYANGASCTVQATPNANYQFMHWNKNGTVASSNASYTFNVNENTELEAVFMPLANAGTVIGEGENTSVYLPSYSYFKYELSQQIYTASELGGSFTINSISFFNAGNEETRSYDVYLVHTDKSSFIGSTDWIVAAQADRVFTGNVTMRTGMWTTIVLETPFTYNGTSNLALIVDDNTNGYTESPHMACRVYNAPQSNQAIYVRSDNINYDPTNPSSYNGSRLSVKNQIMFNRPVYTITATPNNSSMGTVTGAGQYGYGDLCRLTATANSGHTFLDWMRTDGVAVTDEAEYEFIVTGDRTLRANFFEGTDVCNLTFNFDNYDQGWGSHYLEVHFGNGMSHLFGVLNGESTSSFTLPFVNGSHVELNMQNGSFSDQCPFEVRYANGNLVCSSAVLVGESSYAFDMDCEEMPASWVYLGDGDDVTSNYLPSHSYYYYGLSQQIYTAAEIGASGYITSIAFYNQGEDNTKTRTYDIYLKPTSKMEFVNSNDWVSVSEEDKVFSGSVTMVSNEWTVITFDTPFDYDGTSNLVLVMDDNSENWTYAPHMTCRVYYTGLDQAIYICSDYTNYDPSNPSTYNGSLMQYKEKNQVYFGFISSLGCWTPGFLASTDITSNSATLNWEGYQDSYNVRYRVAPPFYEDFEDEESFADNWTFISMNAANAIGGSGSYPAGIYSDVGNNGSNGFRFSSYSSASDYNQYLVSPLLTVSGELNFYFRKPNNYLENFYVGYSTTTNDLEAFTWTEDLVPTTSWQDYTLNLPSNVKYIAFHYYGNYTYHVYLDDITIGANGIPIGDWITVDNVAGTTTEITGLDPQANYLWQVQGNNASCGEEGHTKWSEKATFTTKCEAILVNADNLFFEDFEGTDFAPACWENIPSDNYQWTNNTYQYHSGSASAFSNFYGDIYLVLPDIELSADASTAQLTFWSYNSYPDDFVVGNNTVVLLSGGNETVLWSAETVSDLWEETTIDLSAYLGQTITLAFKYAGDNGNGWYVDDVEVSVAPATTVTQTLDLVEGYNWVSLYVEVEDPMEMLVQLETALGDRGITIDADGIGTENFGDGEWFGDLDFEGVYNEQMYLIQVSEDCTIELEGAPIDPSVHEIYIHAGYNWIGFPYAEELDINVAFSGFEAEDEDYIETPEGISYYFGEWMGDIMTLVPGQGYMYFSNSEDVKTLVIQTGGSKARVKVVSPNKTKNEEKPRPRLDDKR